MSNGSQPRRNAVAVIFCMGNAMHEFMLPVIITDRVGAQEGETWKSVRRVLLA